MCDQIMTRLKLSQPTTDEEWLRLKDDLLNKSEQMSVNCINLHRNDVDCRHFCQSNPFSDTCKRCLSDPNTCNLLLRIDMNSNVSNLNPNLKDRPCCGNIEVGFDCTSCLRHAHTASEVRACALENGSSTEWWVYALIGGIVLLVTIVIVVMVKRIRKTMDTPDDTTYV